LKDDFELTLLTWKPVEVRALNRFHGTSIMDSDLKMVRPNVLVRAVLNLDWDIGSIQPIAYLMRMCHAMRANYDLVITTGTEELDLGGPGILYVHCTTRISLSSGMNTATAEVCRCILNSEP